MFIKDHRYEFSIALMCELLRVSRSGFYAWIMRKPSKRDQANQLLDVKIKSVLHNITNVMVPRVLRVN